MNYRQDIQILRGIAVLLVVLFHLQFTYISSGFLGVDVFFVISGFLMAVLYDPKDKQGFFIRRSKRLLPLYFCVVLITLIGAYFIVIPNDFERIVDQSVFALFFSSNLGFWLEDSYFSKINFSPLLHLWSLGVEIQFYLLLPLTAYFIRLHKSVVWLLCFGSLVCCLFLTGYNSKHTFFMMPFRLWEFLIGYIVASYFTINGNLKYQKEKASWFGLLSILIIMLLSMLPLNVEESNAIYGHPGLIALVICLCTAFVLCFGLPKLFLSSFPATVLEVLGKYSYSIYLIHFPLIALYLYQPFEGIILKPGSLNNNIILISFILFMSFFSFKYVENYFRKTNKRAFGMVLIIVPCIVLSSLIGKSYINYMIPEELTKIFHAAADRSEFRCGKVFKIQNPSALTCPLGSEISTEESIFLVGNSHADVIKKTFTKIANIKNKNVRFMVSNYPLMENSLGPIDVFNEAIKYKANHIVLHFSPFALEQYPILEKVSVLSKLAQEKNIKISFLLPTPTWGTSVPKMLYHANINDKTVQDQKLADVHSMYFDIYEQAKREQYAWVDFYDLGPYFCDSHCKMQDDDGHVLYFDSHHLTLSGAKLLEPLFRDIL